MKSANGVDSAATDAGGDAGGRFRLGDFVVDPSLNQLLRGRRTLTVEPKVMEVLVFLASRSGKVVTKEELLSEVWPDTAASDEALWYAISQLRKLLGDDRRNARFIHTVPKRGYRLIAATRPERPPVGRSTTEAARTRRKAWTQGIGAALLIVAASLAWTWLGGPGSEPQRVVLLERQLTGRLSSNRLRSGVLSPDGRYLAMADRQGLWLQLTNGGQSRRLPTPGLEGVADVAWSPAATSLVFGGQQDGRAGLFSISILGERPRLLVPDAFDPSVSPDGRRLTFLRDGGREIWTAGISGETPSLLLKHRRDRFRNPTFSPDGGSIAFWRQNPDSTRHSIELLDPVGSAVRQVYADSESADLRWRALFWAHDGRILFSYPRLIPQFSATLWELPVRGAGAGSARRLYNFADSFPLEISASSDGRIAFLKTHLQADIGLADDDRSTRPRSLTSDAFFDWPTAWTHAGTGVLFHSNRSGEWDIFEQHIDGGLPRRIVDRPAGEFWPRPSADGRWILFWSSLTRQGVPALETLMRVAPEGGIAETIVQLSGVRNRFDCPRVGNRACLLSRETPDGIVFQDFDPVSGPGAERATLASEGPPKGHMWDLSADGKRILIVSGSPTDRLLVLEVESGQTWQLVTSASPSPGLYSASWASDGLRILASSGRSYFEQQLFEISLDGSMRRLLADPPPGRWRSHPLASPDGRLLLFADMSLRSNVWLLEPDSF